MALLPQIMPGEMKIPSLAFWYRDQSSDKLEGISDAGYPSNNFKTVPVPLIEGSPSLSGVQAAQMEDPEAVTFGLRTSAVCKSALFTLGPLDE